MIRFKKVKADTNGNVSIDTRHLNLADIVVGFPVLSSDPLDFLKFHVQQSNFSIHKVYDGVMIQDYMIDNPFYHYGFKEIVSIFDTYEFTKGPSFHQGLIPDLVYYYLEFS